jgi:transposase
VQQETLGHRVRRDDPLYRVRRLLVTAVERLSDRGWARLETAWTVGDPHDEVYNAWAVKELLRDVYRARTLADARSALADFYAWTGDCGVTEARRLARTVRRWENQILAWHTTAGTSNGRTEAVNLLIKKIKRVGHGFRNFDNYRLRLLLHCGVDWHTPPVARIRARRPAPRLVA